ncbi:MAG: hypothetical protein ABI910_19860, partial [Gemmatimonadota bacterium]
MIAAIGREMRRRQGSRAIGMALALTAVLTVTPCQAWAQRERYAPLVLQLPVSARTLAMGGLTAATQDVDAVFGNPALVGGNNTMSLSGGRYPGGASTGHLATAMNVGSLGIGVGVAMLDAPSLTSTFPLRSPVLLDGGDLPASSLAATVAASFAWKGMRWGAAAKYAEERASLVRGGSVAADVGVSKDIRNGSITTGLMLQNLGRALSGDGSGRDLPARIALGVGRSGYGLGKWFDLGGAANLAVRRDGRVLPSAGGELTYVPIEGVSFSLRAGGRTPELRAQQPLTAGLGLMLDRVSLDYGWEDL